MDGGKVEYIRIRPTALHEKAKGTNKGKGITSLYHYATVAVGVDKVN